MSYILKLKCNKKLSKVTVKWIKNKKHCTWWRLYDQILNLMTAMITLDAFQASVFLHSDLTIRRPPLTHVPSRLPLLRPKPLRVDGELQLRPHTTQKSFIEEATLQVRAWNVVCVALQLAHVPRRNWTGWTNSALLQSNKNSSVQ